MTVEAATVAPKEVPSKPGAARLDAVELLRTEATGDGRTVNARERELAERRIDSAGLNDGFAIVDRSLNQPVEAPNVTIDQKAKALKEAIEYKKLGINIFGLGWDSPQHDQIRQILDPLSPKERQAVEQRYQGLYDPSRPYDPANSASSRLRTDLASKLGAESADFRQIEAILDRRVGAVNDAGQAMEALAQIAEDRLTGEAQLRGVFSTLNAQDSARLQKEFEKKYGKTLDQEMKDAKVSPETVAYVEAFRKGAENRSAADLVRLANWVIDGAIKAREDSSFIARYIDSNEIKQFKELLKDVLAGSSPAAAEARRKLQEDPNFEKKFAAAFEDSGSSDLALRDYVIAGGPSLTTIVEQNMGKTLGFMLNNPDSVTLATQNVSEAERNNFRLGRSLVGRENHASLTSEQKIALDYYNRTHESLTRGADSKTWLAVSWQANVIYGKDNIISKMAATHEDGWVTDSHTADAIATAAENLSAKDWERLNAEFKAKPGNGGQMRADIAASLDKYAPVEKERLLALLDAKAKAGNYELSQDIRRSSTDLVADKTTSDWLGLPQILDTAIAQKDEPGKGAVNLEDRLRSYVLGDDSKPEQFKELLAKMTESEKVELKRAYAAKYGSPDKPADLDRDILSKLDKTQQGEFTNLLSTGAREGRQSFYDNHRSHLDRSGVTIDGTEANMERALRQQQDALEQYQRVYQTLPKEKQELLDQYFNDSLRQYADSKDQLSELAINAVITATALAAAPFTMGMSLQAIALISAGGGAFRLAARSAMMGSDFDASTSNVTKELINGAASAALNFLGAKEIDAIMASTQNSGVVFGAYLARNGVSEATSRAAAVAAGISLDVLAGGTIGAVTNVAAEVLLAPVNGNEVDWNSLWNTAAMGFALGAVIPVGVKGLQAAGRGVGRGADAVINVVRGESSFHFKPELNRGHYPVDSDGFAIPAQGDRGIPLDPGVDLVETKVVDGRLVDSQGNPLRTRERLALDPDGIPLTSETIGKGDGSSTTRTLDAQGTVVNERIAQADGSYSETTTSIDGSSTTRTMDEQGIVIHERIAQADGSHSETITSKDGSSTTRTVDAQGNVVSERIAQPDGAYTETTTIKGRSTTRTVDAQGTVVHEKIVRASGSYTETTTSKDGSSIKRTVDAQGIVVLERIKQADGSYSETITSKDGSTTTRSVDAQGTVVHEKIVQADGSYVETTANKEGTKTEHEQFADGDYTESILDAKGELLGPVLEVNHTASPAFVQKVKESIAKLPDNVRKALGNHGTKVVATGMVTDFSTHWKNRTPRGHAPGSSWDDLDGGYDNLRKSIIVAERTTQGPSFRTEGVVNHESGHAMDHVLGYYSKVDPDFQLAYDQDAAALTPAQRAEEHYLLLPGGIGKSEAFAEVFAALNGASCNPHETARVLSTYPNLARVVKARMSQLL